MLDEDGFYLSVIISREVVRALVSLYHNDLCVFKDIVWVMGPKLCGI